MEQQAQPLQPEQPRRKKVFFTGGYLRLMFRRFSNGIHVIKQ
jgi:hypothetical protein